MKTEWTKKQLDLLREKYPLCKPAELQLLFPEKTLIAIRAKAKILGLKKEKQRFHFSQNQIEELKLIYSNTQNQQLADYYGCSIHTIENKGFQLGLKKDKEFIAEVSRIKMLNPNHGGRRSWIQKGSIPSNKGRKQIEYMSPEAIDRTKATRFKKGQLGWNSKPIGYERVTRDGYIEVKVEEPNIFKLKHRMVWEQNFGPIPDGWNVQFKDKNPKNVDPFNLYIISKQDQCRQNSIYNYPEDIIKTIRLIGKLKKTIKENGEANIN